MLLDAVSLLRAQRRAIEVDSSGRRARGLPRAATTGSGSVAGLESRARAGVRERQRVLRAIAGWRASRMVKASMPDERARGQSRRVSDLPWLRRGRAGALRLTLPGIGAELHGGAVVASPQTRGALPRSLAQAERRDAAALCRRRTAAPVLHDNRGCRPSRNQSPPSPTVRSARRRHSLGSQSPPAQGTPAVGRQERGARALPARCGLYT